jgi:multidrug efflux pump subunit AcrA (membrane-fusion protein)
VQVATVRGARADLDRLLAFKAYATVRAPFAGVVTQRTTDIGDLVGPGATTQQPMFTVADTSRIRLYVGVPQAYAAAMKAGLDATLTVPDHPGETFAARVVGTSDAINPVNGALQVQLLADNKAHALRAGGYAQVSFKVPAQAGAVSIPASALLFRSSGTEVATVGPDNKVRMVPIQIGRDLGKTVEVVSGLTPGARIVDNPPIPSRKVRPCVSTRRIMAKARWRPLAGAAGILTLAQGLAGCSFAPTTSRPRWPLRPNSTAWGRGFRLTRRRGCPARPGGRPIRTRSSMPSNSGC